MLLAPIVRERKGEHVHVFNELKPAVYPGRVNGIVTELEYPPALDKNKKHTIEAVIDRFKVRPDMEQRLAESFETALQIASGIAIASFMDDEDAEKKAKAGKAQKTADLVFSSLFACPVCGHSITELEPRLFSFNNPGWRLRNL